MKGLTLFSCLCRKRMQYLALIYNDSVEGLEMKALESGEADDKKYAL